LVNIVAENVLILQLVF